MGEPAPSSPSNDEQKKKKKQFNGYIHTAKECEDSGDFEAALKAYKTALAIMPDHPKLPNKILKLMEKKDYLSALSDVGGGWQEDPESERVLLDAHRSQSFDMTKTIFDRLYPHQREGVSWMWSLFKKSSGGILGDDMGLGKTIQVSTFIHGLFNSRLIDTVLLIMPLSLMSNWEAELAKWCPKKRVRLFHGTSTNREKALAEIREKSGIILTTYETAQSAFKTLSLDGETPVTWDLIVLDEGHKIKDPTKKTSKAIATFQARSKFILSGTPILNNLKELWALLNYTCDGQLLGDMRVFKKEFEEPIVRGQMKDATEYEKRKGVAVTNKLREVIAPHFIRRMKSDITSRQESPKSSATSEPSQSASSRASMSSPSAKSLSSGKLSSTSNNSQHDSQPKSSSQGSESDATDDLGDELALSLGAVSIRSPVKESAKSSKTAPKPGLTVRKNDLVCWIPIEDFQVDVYTQFLISQRDRIDESIAKNGQALPAVRVLRQIVNHPRLLVSPEKEAQNEITFPGFDLSTKVFGSSIASQSGKVHFLMDLLVHLKEGGHRVLVFSQSTKMLDLIENALDETKRGWQRIRMDGSINKVAERKALVDRYNTDSNIFLFLMTTQVGGVGITLTSADRVVIFDPAWNTAMDDQAADRVYRIGQTRDVIIYRLISSGTIEEKMYRKQVFKGALSKSLLGKEAAVHTYFTRGELRELFIFHPDEVREPKTQNLLSSLHSHKRDTYPALDRELAYLSQMSTLVGITDHNLLYTEEASQFKSHAELDEYAAGAHLALSKTIAPKDVVESEQKEAAIRMARGQRGPVTTIYVDDDSAPRARRDPAQVGTRVGDITLLSIDDQFELGLVKMKATQEKPKQNPFSNAPRSRPGHKFGGNDRVTALPIVQRSSDVTSTAKKPSTSPQTFSKKTGSSGSPVSLPTVSTKPSSSNFPPKKDQPKPTSKHTPTTLPTVVTIKKSGSLPVAQPPSQKPVVQSPASTSVDSDADVDDLLAKLLGDVSIAKNDDKKSSSVAPVAPSKTTTTTTAAQPPSSVVKPKSRRIIEEDDDDLPEAASLATSQSSVGSTTSAHRAPESAKSVAVEPTLEDEHDDSADSLAAALGATVIAPQASAVEVDDENAEMDSDMPLSPVVQRPKAARKSIITFTVLPDEDEHEAFAMDAETLDQEPEAVDSDDDDAESDLESANGSECSEASETEFEITAAQADRTSRSASSKHFLDKSVNDTEDEEADAEDIDGQTDDETESTVEDDDGASLDSFIASEDEEDDEDDDVVEVDERAMVIQRLLNETKTSRKGDVPPAVPTTADIDAAPTMDKKTSAGSQTEKDAARNPSVPLDGPKRGNSQSNGQIASSHAPASTKPQSAATTTTSSAHKVKDATKESAAQQGKPFGEKQKPSAASTHSFSFSQARSKRRIVESDDED